MPSKRPKRPGAAAPSGTPSGTPPGWLRRHRAALTGALVALVALAAALWWWPSGAAAPAAPARQAGSAPRAPAWFDGLPAGAAQPAPAERANRLPELVQQLELVSHTLCSYRDGTRYPNSSRPISEHPDQVRPNDPVTESHAMRKDGGGTDASVRISTSQSRVFLASGEAAAFSLTATDNEGRKLPLFVTRAQARGLNFQGQREVAPVTLAFADGGVGADAVAGDGVFSGLLAPAQTGLAGFNGTIRTEVKYSVGERTGVVLFDVIYTPEIPATWSGQIREAQENGSLNFYMKAEVRRAGRYIVTGRVDDAKGHPFALATFNDTLAVGTREVRLTVFGKLMRDAEPVFPLTLRDIDGYLLKEDTDPDRALMARIVGPAYVSKSYPAKSFSDGEWQSEERTRYLTELGKDVELAKAALSGYAPDQTKLLETASACPPSKGAAQ